jgi:hypothetical protein
MTPGPYSLAVASAASREGVTFQGADHAGGSRVRTVERDGVVWIVGRDGQPLAPVASPRVAAAHGAALARLGLL